MQLGRVKLLLTEDGKASDWRGLAELAELGSGNAYLKIEQAGDPVEDEAWSDRREVLSYAAAD